MQILKKRVLIGFIFGAAIVCYAEIEKVFTIKSHGPVVLTAKDVSKDLDTKMNALISEYQANPSGIDFNAQANELMNIYILARSFPSGTTVDQKKIQALGQIIDFYTKKMNAKDTLTDKVNAIKAIIAEFQPMLDQLKAAQENINVPKIRKIVYKNNHFNFLGGRYEEKYIFNLKSTYGVCNYALY